jgi:hypothetical protein
MYLASVFRLEGKVVMWLSQGYNWGAGRPRVAEFKGQQNENFNLKKLIFCPKKFKLFLEKEIQWCTDILNS